MRCVCVCVRVCAGVHVCGKEDGKGASDREKSLEACTYDLLTM